jgi:hypothetical protein
MVEKLQIVSVRELMNQPVLVKAIQKRRWRFHWRPPNGRNISPSMTQMVAGLEGLSDHEINALLGEEDPN